jgi:cyanophycin synthetase
MKILSVLKLRGPNTWANFPVLEAWVDLEELKDTSSEMIPGFNDRIMSWLPSMIEHRCSIGRRGGFFERLQRGTYMGHILEHVTLELQTLAGTSVGFGRARETSVEGVYKVVVEYLDEQLALACLEAAFQLLQAAIHDRPFNIAEQLEKLRDLAHDVCLGPSTAAIAAAAQARGIPVLRLGPDSLLQLGYGSALRRINAAETDATSAVAETIAQDKQLTCQLLRAIGVPVPAGTVVRDAEQAWNAAQELGLPVVVKPRYGNHGRGVATNLTARDQILAAFQVASDECSSVVVERFAPGDDYRLLVVGGRLAAAARREPACVVGDGRSTIRQLIDQANRDPLRSDGHATVLSCIKLDATSLAVLAEQGHTPESIPAGGKKVFVRRNANLSTGGTATDVTELVHPDVVRNAVDAARMVGLDIAGVDVIARDISQPLAAQGGVVVEINAQPGLRMHVHPSSGISRPVGKAIVDLMFPDQRNGRVPIVAVTGVNGKTTTTRLIAHILTTMGMRVGMTCTDGIYVAGQRIDNEDCSGPQSARSVLMNPQVDAAVFETARGGILREGLAFDLCDVGVVTNIGEGDHLGLSDVHNLEQLAKVKRTVVESVAPHGFAVLNADDPLVAEMAAYCPGNVVFFTRDYQRPSVAKWLQEGGRVAFVRDNAVTLAEGQSEFALLSLERVPLTRGGTIPFQAENVLATAAACWALGVPCEQIRNGLESFSGNACDVPARFNVLELGGHTLIVDYGHNSSSLQAVLQAIHTFSHSRRTAVYSTPGDRRDGDIIRQGELLGGAFDRVILYEDHYRRGRTPGEITDLFRLGLAQGRRVNHVEAVDGWTNAVDLALKLAQPGELMLIQADAIDQSVAYFQKHAAESLSGDRPWHAPKVSSGSPKVAEPAVTSTT